MNKTAINIRTNKEVKEKAQRTAHDLGLPPSTVINAYLHQFIRTKEVHFHLEGELKPAVKKSRIVSSGRPWRARICRRLSLVPKR